MSAWTRCLACALLLVFPLATWPAGELPPRSADHPHALEDVSSLPRRVFASVAEIGAWIQAYAGFLGCAAPVVLERDGRRPW